jgi:5-methylcytosine-specific restriction endonuclease McrA
MTTTDLVPRCPRCQRRHRPDLRCWRGQWVADLTLVVLRTQGTTCWLCGRGGASTCDHVVPRSRGGDDALSNLRPSCQPCNSRRGNGPPFDPDPPTRPAGAALSPRWRVA